jgi:hypothetical protein
VAEEEAKPRQEGRKEALSLRPPWRWGIGGQIPEEAPARKEEASPQEEGEGGPLEEEEGGQEVPQGIPQELGRLEPAPFPLQPVREAAQEGLPGGQV